MNKIAARWLIRILKAFAYGLVGASVMLLVLGIYFLNGKADLKVWHTAKLDAEFTASSEVSSFTEYLELEDRLFTQLDERVYDQIEEEDQREINRYHRGSLSDPGRWPTNWNRSSEFAADQPRAGVLLIHGLSDSPYSLRSLGERLHAAGAHVVNLRVPGHGTAPSALAETTWQDMAAAVELAMRHLHEQAGDIPLYMVGYSNGGALSVHYALSALENDDLPSPEKLVLISPEIGITAMAAFAIWQERIGNLLGLKKLAWTDVLPEYDPFKYNSFPVNAGNLAHELTGVNRSKIASLRDANKLGDFPSVLAFQSAVDATVLAPALVRDLFDHLPENHHELVVFGLNREAEIEPLLSADPRSHLQPITENADRAFTFSVLTNDNPASSSVVVRSWLPGQAKATPTESDTGLSWPTDIYSLSHVALPFPPYDPVYGGIDIEESPGIHLGDVALRGERGALRVSAANMLRLRWNPFYSYLENESLDFLDLAKP